MTTTESALDFSTLTEGMCMLIVSDAALLVQPRKVPGQYPASVPHDTIHAYNILSLGNDMGTYSTHIVSRTGPNETHKLLDRVFYAFVDACCLQLWCDAHVSYIVDGETVRTEQYGFDDGSYTMFYKVYCNVTNADAFLAHLTANVDTDEGVIVARADSSPDGFSIYGLTVG